MTKINNPNLNTKNQETPDMSDFLDFSQYMQDE
jgi:hypothetical protein